MDEILIGESNINKLQYAEDTELLTNWEEKLQALANRMQESSEDWGSEKEIK